MNKKLIAGAILGAAATMLLSAAKKEPVLLTVDGRDVPVSEFLYLYEKNNTQQAEPQTLEEYLDLFVKYKLKVADALHAGIDTTAAFRTEYEGYCNDLAAPFLTDSTVIETLAREAYTHYPMMRQTRHIMLPMGATPDDYMRNYALLDSLRQVIEAGGDFAALAAQYSSDRSAQRNGGLMPYTAAGSLPYPFEEMAYNTPLGQVSEVFEDAPYGLHIVRPEGEKPYPGEVLVRHILRQTRGADAARREQERALIDSLHTLLEQGADFAALASQYSQDPGSARQGGMLPWFGPGRMVLPFEEAAFALADSAISEVIATDYGFHILQRVDSRPVPTYEQARPNIVAAMQRDKRANAPAEARLAQLREQYGAHVDDAVLDKTLHSLDGGLDSIQRIRLLSDWTTVARVGDKKVLVKDAAELLPPADMHAPAAHREMKLAVQKALDRATLATARENLARDDSNYANLVNEYRDGMLLFEISNRNVWERSNKDREGLEAFFNANRDRYTWDAPRYKTIIVSATNDSIAAAAQQWLKENPVTLDSIVMKLRGQFGPNVKVERKIMAQGTDPVVDYYGFGGERPEPTGRWRAMFEYEGVMLDAPGEVADDRARIVNDYQQWLEEQWVEQLYKRYKHKVNKKELKKLQEQQQK